VIPFLDLPAQLAPIRGEIEAAIGTVLDSCEFTLGREVAAFEHEFACYCGTSHAVAVNTGTSALHLALLAVGVGHGDEVITVPFTFVATVAAICYTGAKPVFVDIDPHTFTMDPAALESAITPRTKAVLPVHLYGQPAEMETIRRVAAKHRLLVVEDAAQAHGAEYRGRRAGSLGDIACFSFYPGKNLGACGEGGMVVTEDARHAHKIRMLRDWGAERKYEHVLKGYNYRMEGIQGAVLRVKLRHLEAWNEARRAAAARYDLLLAGSGVCTPRAMQDRKHVYHIYAIRSPGRSAWQRALYERGIHTGIHYPNPVHLLPAYQDLGYRAGQFPESERAASEVLSLPVFPELTGLQSEQVCDALRRLAAAEVTGHSA
jgi:dTDP-4-amino-4,6-dideoxygalactose transaminase